MPWVSRAVLAHLTKDDEEWKQLIRDAEARGFRESQMIASKLVADQKTLIDQQSEIIALLSKAPKVTLPEPGRVTPKLGMEDLRGSGSVVSEPGGQLLHMDPMAQRIQETLHDEGHFPSSMTRADGVGFSVGDPVVIVNTSRKLGPLVIRSMDPLRIPTTVQVEDLETGLRSWVDPNDLAMRS